MESLTGNREFTYYVPIAQFPEAVSLQFFVRTAGTPATLAGPVRASLQPLLPGAAYVKVVPLADIVAPQYLAWQYGARVFTVFGSLALVLAALGLHSLVAYEVEQRTQEFGVRAALGASHAEMLTLVLARSWRLTAVGLGLGFLSVIAIATPLDGLLFQQSAVDLRLLGGVALLLSIVAALAGLAPAFRATKVDPVTALRAE